MDSLTTNESVIHFTENLVCIPKPRVRQICKKHNQDTDPVMETFFYCVHCYKLSDHNFNAEVTYIPCVRPAEPKCLLCCSSPVCSRIMKDVFITTVFSVFLQANQRGPHLLAMRGILEHLAAR